MNAAVGRPLELHPGINFSRLEVGGDLGGFVFAFSSMLVLAAGLPEVRWFVTGAVATAVPIACLLLAWHQRHQGVSGLWDRIDLDLSKRTQ
jgi:hypothetical protein